MPILMRMDCSCCKLSLHHCEKCWNQFHNGLKHKDYIAPEYFGQSMFSEESHKSLEKFLGKKIERKVEPPKDKKYREGDYGH